MKVFKETFDEKFKKAIHPILRKALSMHRSFKLQVIGQIPSGGPYLFIANHFCIDDIPTPGEVIQKHTYVLVSDEDKRTLDGLALSLNGVVWTNRSDKKQRKYSKDALVRHLHLGHNILMYPEATWNLSPNLLMLPMNFGCITISLETGIPIIPLYLYFTDDICYVEINQPYFARDDKIKSIEELRDIMATSAWNFYEKYGKAERKTLGNHYLEDDIDKRYSKYARARKNPKDVRKYESQFIFKPKGQVEYTEAFAHLSGLKPNLNNAFLFNKRLI